MNSNPTFHLAQVNIARMIGAGGDQAMQGLVRKIEEMNQLAEQSPGFIWRLKGTEIAPGSLECFSWYYQPFDADVLFYNMSVWESVEALHSYVYRTRHKEMLRGKEQWIANDPKPLAVMWWVAPDNRPTIQESSDRVMRFLKEGPSPECFSWHSRELHHPPMAL